MGVSTHACMLSHWRIGGAHSSPDELETCCCMDSRLRFYAV
jgi:hypothetical protein